MNLSQIRRSKSCEELSHINEIGEASNLYFSPKKSMQFQSSNYLKKPFHVLEPKEIKEGQKASIIEVEGFKYEYRSIDKNSHFLYYRCINSRKKSGGISINCKASIRFQNPFNLNQKLCEIIEKNHSLNCLRFIQEIRAEKAQDEKDRSQLNRSLEKMKLVDEKIIALIEKNPLIRISEQNFRLTKCYPDTALKKLEQNFFKTAFQFLLASFEINTI